MVKLSAGSTVIVDSVHRKCLTVAPTHTHHVYWLKLSPFRELTCLLVHLYAITLRFAQLCAITAPHCCQIYKSFPKHEMVSINPLRKTKQASISDRLKPWISVLSIPKTNCESLGKLFHICKIPLKGLECHTIWKTIKKDDRCKGIFEL